MLSSSVAHTLVRDKKTLQGEGMTWKSSQLAYISDNKLLEIMKNKQWRDIHGKTQNKRRRKRRVRNTIYHQQMS